MATEIQSSPDLSPPDPGPVAPQRGGIARGLLVGIGVGIALLVLATGLAISSWSSARLSSPLTTQSVSHPGDGAQSARVALQFGAGELQVGALDAADGTFARSTYSGPEVVVPEPTYRVVNGVAELDYAIRQHDARDFFMGHSGENARMHLQLARRTPLSMHVDAGAADATLDLTGLLISRLELETGAATTRLRLPEAAGWTDVLVDAGITELIIDVPSNVAADIQVGSGLSSRNIAGRFPAVGNGHYRSADFDTAPNRATILLDLGISSVTVR